MREMADCSCGKLRAVGSLRRGLSITNTFALF